MKKIIAAMMLLSGVASASTSSLELSLFPSGNVLGTINLNHNLAGKGYYKIDMYYSIEDDRGNDSNSHFYTQGVYHNFLKNWYIVDNPTNGFIETISKVSENISIQTCTDSTFNSCSVIDQKELHMEFNGSLITSISPSIFDVTV